MTTAQISWNELTSVWQQSQAELQWHCLFSLPFWLETVCRCLGSNGTPLILKVVQDGKLIGVGAFSVAGTTAHFLGISDVCDYQDIMTRPGLEPMVVQSLLGYLADHGIQRLDLRTLRPDSAFIKGFDVFAEKNPFSVKKIIDDVTYETALPNSWDDFLRQLNGKQRHEVRRKLRRLTSHGAYAYRMADNNGALFNATDLFLELFQMNREDKARFMDDTMSVYFRDLIQALSDHQMLRLYFLDVENIPAATVLCFDYNQVRYLYNSGYNAHYQNLSVGVLSKLLSIQTGIEAGCRHFDFLKGSEIYKKRIGGTEVPLYRFKIELK